MPINIDFLLSKNGTCAVFRQQKKIFRQFESSQPRSAVLEEGRQGKELYGVRGTPTIMRYYNEETKRLRHPIAFPAMRDERITAVQPLPCCGEGCYQATRALFDQALEGAGHL